MNLPDHLLPLAWYWLAHALYAVVLGVTLYRAPWRRIRDSEHLHLWLGTCVALMLMWSYLKTGIKPGLNFHVLGATLLTLMFGPHLAFVGLSVILLGVTWFGFGGWESFSVNALLMGALPVTVSHFIYRLVDARLPNHFFVYIFGNAFIGGGLSIVVTGTAATAMFALSGAYTLDYLTGNYLPYYLFMGWSEAWLTGMLTTLLVVYKPEWVVTFDDMRYLRNK